MPGLINDSAYDAARESICSGDPRAERVFDAVEWALLSMVTPSDCELVSDTRHGRVYGYRMPETDNAPGLLVVFATETFRGDLKWLLLDAAILDRIEEPTRRVRRRKSTK